MTPFTERDIRASFANASRKEAADLALPAGFAEIDFSRRDFLGWADPRLPKRAYVVADLDGRPVGVLLRQADQRLSARSQCAWCDDITLAHDVQFFAARKAGAAGRKGDVIGTLVCADFACSQNVRKLPPLAYEGYDREAAREARIERLRAHVRAFVRELGVDG
ncbi:FBP domain-containing protein [Microbacterium sp. NPDC055683]